MEDIFWIAVSIAFFAISIAYVRFCDRVKWSANAASLKVRKLWVGNQSSC